MFQEAGVAQVDALSLVGWFCVAACAGVALVLTAAALFRRYDRGIYSLEVAVSKLLVVSICRIWYRLRRVGNETIPGEGPVIVAANHTCSIDPILLTTVCPRRYIGFIIAKEYSHIPILRYWTKMVDCIPVNRDGLDAAGARAAMRHLRAGKILGIFPEGRIPPPGETADPKEGVAMLALRTGATVIPVHISGTRYADNIYVPLLFPHKARVAIGPPIDLSAYFSTKRNRETVAAAAEAIMRGIQALGETPDAGVNRSSRSSEP